MKRITRARVKVDRVACPWLIKKFVDRDAEFLFVPAQEVREVATREGAISLYQQAEGPGLEAIAEGFRRLGLPDDPGIIEKESIVYDALYAYAQEGAQWKAAGDVPALKEPS